MRHFPATLVAAALALALGGCKPRPIQQKLPSVTDVFSTVVLPPQSTMVSRQGGPDVLQLTLASPSSPDSVAAYYRAVFANDPFVLISDTKGKDGSVSMYAEESHRPMWVRIAPAAQGEGTTVELSGAVTPKPRQEATRPSSAGAQVSTQAASPGAPASPAAPAVPARDSAARR